MRAFFVISLVVLLVLSGCVRSPTETESNSPPMKSVEAGPDFNGLGPFQRLREYKRWKRQQRWRATEEAAKQGRDLPSEIKARYIDALIPNEIF